MLRNKIKFKSKNQLRICAGNYPMEPFSVTICNGINNSAVGTKFQGY